jgi:hypothetical protein
MALPVTRNITHERVALLVLGCMGLACATLLYALDKPTGAGAIVLLVNSILGMLGWRRAHAIPEGGAALTLTGAALERSGISGELAREALAAEIDAGRRGSNGQP